MPPIELHSWVAQMRTAVVARPETVDKLAVVGCFDASSYVAMTINAVTPMAKMDSETPSANVPNPAGDDAKKTLPLSVIYNQQEQARGYGWRKDLSGVAVSLLEALPIRFFAWLRRFIAAYPYAENE